MEKSNLGLEEILLTRRNIFVELKRNLNNIYNHLNLKTSGKIVVKNQPHHSSTVDSIEYGYNIIKLHTKDHISQKYFPGVVMLLHNEYSTLYNAHASKFISEE